MCNPTLPVSVVSTGVTGITGRLLAQALQAHAGLRFDLES